VPELAHPRIARDAPIATWFGVGGRARRLAQPDDADGLRACLALDPNARVLGDGANLLVRDGHVRELVIALDAPAWRTVRIDARASLVHARAGASLPRLVTATARAGLGGLHTLGGVPATVGGAVAMNAGGRFGCVADTLQSVTLCHRDGTIATVDAAELGASYRDGGVGRAVVLDATFALTPRPPAELREELKAIMADKKASQPLADRSAGCVFRNPVLPHDLAGVGAAGERTSAGLLLDRAGCKGLAVGGARVSDRHANFVVVDRTAATAADVLALMDTAAGRVRDTFGVALEPEVRIWGEAP